MYTTNKALPKSIKYLIQTRFPELNLSKLKVNKSKKENVHDKYYFYILAKSRENYLKLIGFDHPEKLEDLEFNIKRSSYKRKTGEKGLTKKNILENLKIENLTAKQLSRKTYISHGTILGHLNQLRTKDLVKTIEKGKKNEQIWSLNHN